SISYMTASNGLINIYLNNVSIYEDNNLTTGESFEKSLITISCDIGSEVSIIENICEFGALDRGKSYIKFDATSYSSYGQFSGDIKAFIRENPVNRVTKLPSLTIDSSFTPSSSNVLNDIDFSAENNKPILDLDCRDATYSLGALASWVNAGTGGAAYDVDVASSVGTISEYTGSSANGFNVNAVSFNTDSYAVLSSTLTIREDYTIYVVFTHGLSGNEGRTGSMYGSASGETVGFNATAEYVGKQPLSKNIFGVRHEGRVGLPASTPVSVDYDEELPTVIVIRRDKSNNISTYNYTGELISSIEAKVSEVDEGVSSVVVENGDTAGVLNIIQIASAGGDTNNSFKGGLGRFGVISRDIGSVASKKLAIDLYNLYKL
ncbi:MAG: hypothetical protein O3C54_04195, partial [Proteobacteria bacterium]|nr:hypothetical protein [Pseudomonadota bacterium]